MPFPAIEWRVFGFLSKSLQRAVTTALWASKVTFRWQKNLKAHFYFSDPCRIMSEQFSAVCLELLGSADTNAFYVSLRISLLKIFFGKTYIFLSFTDKEPEGFCLLSRSTRRGCQICNLPAHRRILTTEMFFKNNYDFFTSASDIEQKCFGCLLRKLWRVCQNCNPRVHFCFLEKWLVFCIFFSNFD